MKKKNDKIQQLTFIFIIAVMAFLYWGMDGLQDAASPVSGTMEVHFIDVGQGDSILIKTEESCILVDGGDRGTRDSLIAYLKKQGVHTLDLLVGTHPHSDHIGGLTPVINEFTVKKVMMPKAETTSETFRKLLLAIEDKGLRITAPTPGEVIEVGQIQCTVLAPNSNNYLDLNNASIVLKAMYGEVSFLLTGDAEKLSEDDILQRGYDLKAQVLKVGHHGSSSSTGQEFLDAVNPDFAVISCKTGNEYGHPNQVVLDQLESKNVEILRTDISGDIVLITDGKTVMKR